MELKTLAAVFLIVLLMVCSGPPILMLGGLLALLLWNDSVRNTLGLPRLSDDPPAGAAGGASERRAGAERQGPGAEELGHQAPSRGQR